MTKMNDAIKWLLGGLGLYLVYTEFLAPAATSSSPTTGTTGTTSTAPLTIYSVQPAALTAGVTQSLSVSLAGAIAPVFSFNGSTVSASGNPVADPTVAVVFTLAIPAPSAGPGVLTISDSGRTATANVTVSGSVAPPSTSTSTSAPGSSSSSGSGSSGGAVNSTFSSSDFGSQAWISRVAALMVAAAGNNSQNYDNWSYFYQHQAAGSPISASLMSGIISANGNTSRGNMIPATTFLNALVTSISSGLSGFGAVRQVRLPISAMKVSGGVILRNGAGARLFVRKGGG